MGRRKQEKILKQRLEIRRIIERQNKESRYFMEQIAELKTKNKGLEQENTGLLRQRQLDPLHLRNKIEEVAYHPTEEERGKGVYH